MFMLCVVNKYLFMLPDCQSVRVFQCFCRLRVRPVGGNK